MDDMMNAARLSELLAMLEKILGSAAAPPIERMALAGGFAAWRADVKSAMACSSG